MNARQKAAKKRELEKEAERNFAFYAKTTKLVCCRPNCQDPFCDRLHEGDAE